MFNFQLGVSDTTHNLANHVPYDGAQSVTGATSQGLFSTLHRTPYAADPTYASGITYGLANHGLSSGASASAYLSYVALVIVDILGKNIRQSAAKADELNISFARYLLELDIQLDPSIEVCLATLNDLRGVAHACMEDYANTFDMLGGILSVSYEASAAPVTELGCAAHESSTSLFEHLDRLADKTSSVLETLTQYLDATATRNPLTQQLEDRVRSEVQLCCGELQALKYKGLACYNAYSGSLRRFTDTLDGAQSVTGATSQGLFSTLHRTPYAADPTYDCCRLSAKPHPLATQAMRRAMRRCLDFPWFLRTCVCPMNPPSPSIPMVSTPALPRR